MDTGVDIKLKITMLYLKLETDSFDLLTSNGR